MERWKENKAIFIYKVRNGCFVENMTSMLNVANNKNYRLRSHTQSFAERQIAVFINLCIPLFLYDHIL